MIVNAVNSRNNVSFQKNVKQIVDETSNTGLKKIIKQATSSNSYEAIEFGIPGLYEYAQKGPKEKEEVTNLLKDMIDSKELRAEANSKGLFNGYKGMEDEFPGYIRTYEKLTGIRLDVKI